MASDGMLSLEELGQRAELGEFETVLMVYTDPYGRLMGKRFDVDYFLDEVADYHSPLAAPLLMAEMEMQESADERYDTLRLVPDLATLRVANWLPQSALVIADLRTEDYDWVALAPRNILHEQIIRASEQGYTPRGSIQVEYKIFLENFRQAADKSYGGLERMGWYREDYDILQGNREELLNGTIRRNLKRSGVPVVAGRGGAGPGQHEITLPLDDLLRTADRLVLARQCAKDVADQLRMSLTFMAQYETGGEGSACSLHLSLWEAEQNLFVGEAPLGPLEGSDINRWFLGGWLRHAPELMVFYASTLNAYKRYQQGATHLKRLTWQPDHRPAPFRVSGDGRTRHLESTLPGADCNPYLALAAALASGLDGIANQIEPPAPGEAAAALPRTLRDATERFAASDFARATFGEEVVEGYSAFLRQEQAAADRVVTDWERRRYFERV